MEIIPCLPACSRKFGFQFLCTWLIRYISVIKHYSKVRRFTLYIVLCVAGISPGSMPPHSTFLWQEGATFKSFKIVKAGEFQVNLPSI